MTSTIHSQAGSDQRQRTTWTLGFPCFGRKESTEHRLCCTAALPAVAFSHGGDGGILLASCSHYNQAQQNEAFHRPKRLRSGPSSGQTGWGAAKPLAISRLHRWVFSEADVAALGARQARYQRFRVHPSWQSRPPVRPNRHPAKPREEMRAVRRKQ